MTRRSFTIETRGSAIAIFGGPPALSADLVSELLLLGIHAIAPTSLSEIDEVRTSHDLDYLVVFLPISESDLITSLQPFIDSGESRLITISHTGAGVAHSPLTPVFKQITFSDYVGVGEFVSPLLEGWLSSIKIDKTLVIPGDGLEEISLLGQADLAHLLALSVTSRSTEPGEKITLGNPDPISLLNLAYHVRTCLPFKLTPTFVPGDDHPTHFFDPDTYVASLDKLNYVLANSVEANLKTYLVSHVKAPTIHATITPEPPQPTQPTTTPKPLPPRKLTPLKVNAPVFIPLQSRQFKRAHPPRLHSVVGRGLVIAFALYLGTLAFALTITSLSLRQIAKSLRANESPAVSTLSRFSLTYIRANWIALTSIPGLSKQPLVADATLLLDAYSQALSAFTTAQQLNTSTQDLIHYIFGSGNADIASLISLSRLQAEELYGQLSLLDGALPVDPPNIIPLRYRASYQDGKAKLVKLKRSVTTAKALLATAPDVIGLGGRKKYAILFQNNMELRATGGFIGSFAIVSFENGKLYDMPIYDVYDADGQLKGHVEPPTAIKEILGEANWYLRDSNFDPDFPTSARRAEWFIKKSLNLDLDGTIALNVNTLTALLGATGPIELPDYQETITPTNLYERAQFHAEVNFFPGSTQKKEFLSTVASALFSKLPTLGAGEGFKLAAALAGSIEERDTLVSLLSASPNHVFQTLGWNGELLDSPCPTSGPCHKDYAMVVDSNFGVNKANYFITRNIEEIITFDKNLAVFHVLRLHYQNTSTSMAWPAGTYKNYQRLYLPIGATLTKLTVGDQVLEPKDYSISGEHSKLVIAYLVSVPINSRLDVEVEYSTPQLPQDNELLYTWYWQKQPGTSKSDNLTVYLNYPMYLTPSVISPQAELMTQQLKFEFSNDADHRVAVKFTK